MFACLAITSYYCSEKHFSNNAQNLLLENIEALSFPEFGSGIYIRRTSKCDYPWEYKTAVSCQRGGTEECYPSDC